jgi:hypothetical protein
MTFFAPVCRRKKIPLQSVFIRVNPWLSISLLHDNPLTQSRKNIPRNRPSPRGDFTNRDFFVSLFPEQHHFLAGRHIARQVSHIDHQLIHGDAAKDGTAFAADKHLRAFV